MARLRDGRANTARGAGHVLRETIGRVRHAGPAVSSRSAPTSGFYAHAVVAVCRAMGVRFSITIRQSPATRRLIEAIPEEAWTPIAYWLDGGADVAETSYVPFTNQPDAAPRLTVGGRPPPQGVGGSTCRSAFGASDRRRYALSVMARRQLRPQLLASGTF